MSEIAYYIIDTETNGMMVNYHEITEISVIRYIDRHQLSYNIKIKFPWKSNAQSLKVTNKTKEDLKQGKLIEEVIPSINKFIEEDGLDPEYRCIVGHKIIGFDRKFLRETWKQLNLKFPACLWLDTVKYTKEFVKQAGIKALNGYNLANALHLVGIEIPQEGQHTAKYDCQNNYRLFKKIKDAGIDHLSSIKRYPHGYDA